MSVVLAGAGRDACVCVRVYVCLSVCKCVCVGGPGRKWPEDDGELGGRA